MKKILKKKIRKSTVVDVIFKERGTDGWSHSYTYQDGGKDYFRGDIVLVPTGSFYSIGMVSGVREYDDTHSGIIKTVVCTLNKYVK
jgi:hypothetical protein